MTQNSDMFELLDSPEFLLVGLRLLARAAKRRKLAFAQCPEKLPGGQKSYLCAGPEGLLSLGVSPEDAWVTYLEATLALFLNVESPSHATH